MKLLRNLRDKARRTGKINKRLVTFVFCLIIASSFWVINSLNKSYNVSVVFPVVYNNFPEKKVVVNSLPEAVNVNVYAKGYNLLAYKLKAKKLNINIDVNDARFFKEGTSYLVTNSKLGKIEEQLPRDIKLTRISPDTVFFQFKKRVRKNVPVKPKIQISFKQQFHYKDTVVLFPDRIEISGSEEDIKKIEYVETELLELENIDDNVRREIYIDTSLLSERVKLAINKVVVDIPVSKYTEKIIELPIELRNLPKGYSIKVFPEVVSVKFLVSYEDYEIIDKSMFHIVADCYKAVTGVSDLKLEIVKSPEKAKSAKVEPERVEFILKKYD